jgi:hypothetical protein
MKRGKGIIQINRFKRNKKTVAHLPSSYDQKQPGSYLCLPKTQTRTY